MKRMYIDLIKNDYKSNTKIMKIIGICCLIAWELYGPSQEYFFFLILFRIQDFKFEFVQMRRNASCQPSSWNYILL